MLLIAPFLPDIKFGTQLLCEFVKKFGIGIYKFLNRHLSFFGRLNVLQGILIPSGELQYIITDQTSITRDHIRLDKLQRMTNVWFCVYIWNCRSDIKLPHATESILLVTFLHRAVVLSIVFR